MTSVNFTSLKALSPHIVTLGLGLQHMNLGVTIQFPNNRFAKVGEPRAQARGAVGRKQACLSRRSAPGQRNRRVVDSCERRCLKGRKPGLQVSPRNLEREGTTTSRAGASSVLAGWSHGSDSRGTTRKARSARPSGPELGSAGPGPGVEPPGCWPSACAAPPGPPRRRLLHPQLTLSRATPLPNPLFTSPQ